MGRQVYLTDADIKAFELLELLFDADVGNTGDYSMDEEKAVLKLSDKVNGRKESN